MKSFLIVIVSAYFLSVPAFAKAEYGVSEKGKFSSSVGLSSEEVTSFFSPKERAGISSVAPIDVPCPKPKPSLQVPSLNSCLSGLKMPSFGFGFSFDASKFLDNLKNAACSFADNKVQTAYDDKTGAVFDKIDSTQNKVNNIAEGGSSFDGGSNFGNIGTGLNAGVESSNNNIEINDKLFNRNAKQPEPAKVAPPVKNKGINWFE